MEEQTKLSLSKEEKELVANAEWILTKNAILEKVKGKLSDLYHFQQQLLREEQYFKEFPLKQHGKISKGENYLGLPYLILDYPRCFERNHIFAIRSFFWWGRFFSTTLHISGRWQILFSDKLRQSYDLLQQHNFGICTEANEWSHNLQQKDSFVKLDHLTKKKFWELLRNPPFVKIAVYTSIQHLSESTEIWEKQFEVLIRALC